jgi:L-lysine 6-transaminase
MVRSTRILEIIRDDGLPANAAKLGAWLLDGLHALEAEFPRLISQVRGRGLMIAFDLPDHDRRHNLIAEARAQGLLLLPCGPASVRLRPFLDLTREAAAIALDRLADALRRLA